VEPRLVARYRSTIEDGLRRALAGDAPLRAVLRVHVGLEDESGVPTEALGKLIRPVILLFIAEELGDDPDAALSAAVSLELVHEFSLIHDDLQDGDKTRRGRPTVWSRWGEPQAINAGDLMLALALVEAGSAGDKALGRLLDAVIEMVEGQALDVSFEARWPSMGEYTAMTDKKTGALFRCACELGVILCGVPRETRRRLSEVGRELGRAVQIRNDLLGIWGSESVLDEPIGADLRRRKKTYPLVAAMAKADEGERRALEVALAVETISGEAAERIVETMERLRVREDGVHRVNEHLEHVLSEWERLPLTKTGMDGMEELCESLRLTKTLGGAR
jgi:geranylgeranyl diphosphate synthase type I